MSTHLAETGVPQILLSSPIVDKSQVSNSPKDKKDHDSIRSNEMPKIRHSGSVFSYDLNKPHYHARHLDGNHAVPKTPRRLVEDNIDEEQDQDDASDNIPVDPVNVDPYLLDLASTKFNVIVFLGELFFHLFMPLALYRISSFEGRIYLTNRSFIGLDFNFYVQWTMYASLIAANIITFVDKPTYFFAYDIIFLDILFIIRSAVVATKYAYVSSLEYKEMSQTLESKQVKTDRLVIAGWSKPSRNSVDTQILLASVRQHVDLTNAKFLEMAHSKSKKISGAVVENLKGRFAVLDNQGDIKSEPELESQPEKDQTKIRSFSAWSVAASLIEESHQIKYNNNSLWVFVVLHSVAPYVVRSATGLPVFGGTEYNAYLLSLLCLPVSIFLLFSNASFVLIAIMDIRRRLYLQERLNGFLLDGYIEDPSRFEQDIKDNEKLSKEPKELVRVDMKQPENILSWWYLRLVLQDYGLQFYKRITSYSGLFILYSLSIIIYLLANAVLGRTTDLELLVLGNLNIIFVLSSTIWLSYYAQRLIRIRRTHAATAIYRRIDLDQILSKNELKKSNKLNETTLIHSKEIFNTISEAIRTDNELFVVRILGISASAELIQIAFALIATGIASAVKLFMSNKSDSALYRIYFKIIFFKLSFENYCEELEFHSPLG